MFRRIAFISAGAFLLALTFACDVDVEILTRSDKPVWVQMEAYNGTKTVMHGFKKNNESIHYRLKGLFCNLKPTAVRTFAQKKDTKFADESQAFIEGIGKVRYLVGLGDEPTNIRMGQRVGVFCGFGDCGSRG